MVLTRHLYIKEEVEVSLLVSMLERTSLRECQFWLHELLGSGFDVTHFIWKVFYDFYFEYHPKVEIYVFRKLQQWTKHGDPNQLRSIIRQLSHLSASPTVYRRRMAGEEPPTLEALANGADVAAYWEGASTYTDEAHRLLAMESQLRVPDNDLPETTYIIGGSFPSDIIAPTSLRPDNVLKHVRRFPIRRDIGALVPPRKFDPDAPFANWEYDAYETPCWKERFQAYGATPNHVSRRIEFPNDDQLEAFYEKYGYEPDEQSSATQQMSHAPIYDKIEIETLRISHPHQPW